MTPRPSVAERKVARRSATKALCCYRPTSGKIASKAGCNLASRFRRGATGAYGLGLPMINRGCDRRRDLGLDRVHRRHHHRFHHFHRFHRCYGEGVLRHLGLRLGRLR